MTVGEVLAIVGGCISLISVIIAILGFNRSLKKDREERAAKEQAKSNKDVEFYTTTALTLGGLKESLADIKKDMLRRQLKDEQIEEQIKGLEQRIVKLETILKIKN